MTNYTAGDKANPQERKLKKCRKDNCGIGTREDILSIYSMSILLLL